MTDSTQTSDTETPVRALVEYPGHKHSDNLRDDYHVGLIQKRLKDYGFYAQELEVDSEFGPRTKSAIIHFQKIAELKQDGIVGPKTWDKLKIYNR